MPGNCEPAGQWGKQTGQGTSSSKACMPASLPPRLPQGPPHPATLTDFREQVQTGCVAPWVQATLEPALRVASSPQHCQPSLGPVLLPLVSCQTAGRPGPTYSCARATGCFAQQLQTPWYWRLVDLRLAGPGGAVPSLGARTLGAVGGGLLQGGLQGGCDRGLWGSQDSRGCGWSSAPGWPPGRLWPDWKRGQRFSSCHLSCFLASVSPSGPWGWVKTASTPTLGHLVNCNVCEWVGLGWVCRGLPHPQGTSEPPDLTFLM